MTELVFIATDFQRPEEGGLGARGERLPQLDLFLSRARRIRFDGDWRDWLGASLASPSLARLSLAATAGAAFRDRSTPEPPQSTDWFATPVHLFAGLDSLHIHPAGLLSLGADQQRRLAEDFARVFADSPWRLEPVGRRDLLLSGPVLNADGADPATLLGGDPSPGLPSGEGAGMLRGLGSEIEMWLYEHAVNREREARGELSVTALWPWGARMLRPSPGMRLQQPQLYGDDSYAGALFQLLRLKTGTLSAGLDAIQAVPNRITSDTVVLMEHLAAWEQHGLPAALRAVRERRVNLHLIAGANLFSVSSWRLMQWWRQPRAWWELLS